ncbi:MAG: hypothetical protein ACN4G0_10300 [Polyangiales bacterium]
MSRLSMLTVLALTACLGSCAPGIDVPPAPDLEPVLQAYANPTVAVGSEIMAAVADEIAQAAEEIQDSEIFGEILNVIIEVQEEIENSTARTCNGGSNNGNVCTNDSDCPSGTCGSDLVLGGVCGGGTNDGGDCADDTDCPDGGTCNGGVTVPSPTGAFRINYICPGWDERQFEEGYDDSPDPANGSIDLFMTLDSGGIGRVVWGTAAQCLYLVPNVGGSCEGAGCAQASYDGGVALDLGPDWVDEDVSQIPVTFVVEGNIGFDGDDFRINQSFRVVLAVESGLVILVDIGDPALSETFNYIFAGETQAIRDANGLLGCSLEESRCFDENGDTLFSW